MSDDCCNDEWDADGWCFSEQAPYNIEDLGNEALATGCPLCGDNCWEKAKENEI